MLGNDLDFSKIVEDDWIFIDWLDTNTPVSGPEVFVEQAEVLEKAIRAKLITLVFDRNLSLKEKEIKWLSKFDNVVLLEPALNYRKNFVYLPYWLHIHKDLKLFDAKEFDLYYSKNFNDETKLFYEKFFGEYPEFTMSEDLQKCKYVVLVNSNFQNNIGYLPDLQLYFKNNIIPLLHHENKFFHSAFKELVVNNIKDVKDLIGIYEIIDWALLKSLQDRIGSIFPEMRVDNVIRKIKSIVEEKRNV
ncbi:MAG: hypothetical protein WC503_03060 [Candidatus Shapirobacteria bacterium]